MLLLIGLIKTLILLAILLIIFSPVISLLLVPILGMVNVLCRLNGNWHPFWKKVFWWNIAFLGICCVAMVWMQKQIDKEVEAKRQEKLISALEKDNRS